MHYVPSLAALSGLCFEAGEFEFAKRALSSMIAQQRGGLLPDLITEVDCERGHSSPSSTLFLFEAVRELMARLSMDDPFIRKTAYPALARAFVRLRSPRFKRLSWVTDEGLVANADSQRPLTWMNARVGNWIVTPRRGLAIELQALWSKGCETLSRLAHNFGHTELAAAAERACVVARASFRRRFWCSDTDYPYDCVSEGGRLENAWADASIRPNALMALAIDPALFETWQAEAILARVRQDLLTPRGIRTLAPHEPDYQGYHEGGLEEREGSAHQGTVWPHLLGYYVRASVRMAPDDTDLRKELRDLIEAAMAEPLAICQVAEMADGEPPNRFRACPASAWAVAEFLRALAQDLEY
jgi:predicted glycogen debranching enzyme